ncbi:MAG: helix-turn-helix transcriptional regulator [Syntrophales bacterium]|nr:helix-turn-helix transcriptional regulator [Syntrophales bacterium]
MQAHTRKRHIESVEVKFIGPIVNMAKAIEALRPLGFVDTSESIPWREAFPEYKDDDLPGVCLRASRSKEGISQRQLSELTGIPQRHISEMENGKRSIGKEMAKRLGKALNIGYKVFL